jgi:hypothetical protein
MAQSTFYTDWPLSERQSPPGGPASEMSEAFFDTFHKRDENLRTRLCPGDNMTAISAAPPSGVWTPLPVTASTIWIPTWAERLVVRCWMALSTSMQQDDSAVGYARPKLGTSVGSEMRVQLACEFDYTGGPNNDQPRCFADAGGDGWPGSTEYFKKQSTIEIPEAMRGTEQPFIYEVLRNSAKVTVIRIFNDARDAALGYRHRHWLFLEASDGS